ncbi:hypothetical protein DIPPA_07098 [Diplonema papillatum]|nr:hypothetical protein DIPPA_07098 [Diplonema papillatum]
MKTKRRKELQEHASEVETMEKQRDDAEEELTRVRERLRVAEVEAEGNAREIRRLGAEATRALAAVEELREEVVVLQGERAEAQTVLQEATRASDHLRRELNEARTAVPGAAGAAGKKLPIVDPQKSYQLFAALQKALSDASQLEQDWGKVYTSISKHMKNQWEVPCRQSGA